MLRYFSKYTKSLSILIVLSTLFPVLIFARAAEFYLTSPYWEIRYDRAGYVDITYWYPSPSHPFARHEMMTGDWAAAVSYSGLNETNTSEWLTDSFVIPSFVTGSPFDFGTYNVSNDPCNPVWEDDTNQPSNPPYSSIQNDTGWSSLDDDQLEVKIHYEVVDLAFGDPNNNTARSPMSFVDDNESFYVNSERYIILQTYVFRNISDSNTITNLEFYQMLHGHPADAYSNLAGSYNAIELLDPLEDYEPFNSVHCAPDSNTVGNFRYDITQWNETTSAHKDYLTFSSVIAPDEVGFDEFENITSAMRDDIENRDLNGQTSWKNDDMAGAAMWYLPDLDPNETTSITLALMYGCGEPTDSGLWVDKYDDIDPHEVCGVDPSSDDPNDYEITYTIEYGNDGNDIAYNCVLTDYLPIEVDYPVTYTLQGTEMVSSDPNYNETNHTYTWDIGTLNPNDSGSVTLTVYANSAAEPGGEIINEAILNSDQGWVKDTWSTPVCCYDSNVVYVDAYATGAETGTNWDSAYTDFQDALGRVRDCGAIEIWVARGIYKPDRGTGDQTDAFELVDGVPVYGGFNGTETSISQRDFVKNKTILSGNIDTDGGSDSNKIVSFDTCDSDTILDGFIIADGRSGIYAEDSSAVITNCIVADNSGDGIYCLDSDIEISWSIIKNNTGTSADGIHIQGSTSNPVIYNCKIRDNEQYGIYALNGAPIVKNSWIHHNDRGICLNALSSAATIRGNTICDNYQEGIIRTSGTAPSVSNCILWGNDMDDTEVQLSGATTTYSCVYDPNTSSSTPDANGNITADPSFAYSDPDLNNYHLDPDSPCENKGNPNGTYTGEKDIDVQDRVYDSRVDMGADEITCGDVYNELDWTGNGIVNMEEFAIFSAAWLSHDPNDPDITTDPNYIGEPNYVAPNAFVNWNPTCDINSDYAVNVNDFASFCEEWLWQACYKTSQEGTLMMLESLGGNDGQTQRMSVMAEVSIDTFSFAQLSKEREEKYEQALKASIPQPTVKEQLDNIVDFLEELWKYDEEVRKTISEKDWIEFMDHIYEWHDSLESLYLSEQK